MENKNKINLKWYDVINRNNIYLKWYDVVNTNKIDINLIRCGE